MRETIFIKKNPLHPNNYQSSPIIYPLNNILPLIYHTIINHLLLYHYISTFFTTIFFSLQNIITLPTQLQYHYHFIQYIHLLYIITKFIGYHYIHQTNQFFHHHQKQTKQQQFNTISKNNNYIVDYPPSRAHKAHQFF